jgi:hypothetical protein
MTAETVVEIYRTQEDRGSHFFVSAVTISYFGNRAFIQGLSGTMTIRCWRELKQYLIERGVEEVEYYRKGVLKTLSK